MALTEQQQRELGIQLRKLAEALDPQSVSPPATTSPPAPVVPVVTPALASAPFGATGSWKLKFQDDFDKPELDLTKWRNGDYEKADGYFRDFNDKSVAFYVPEQTSIRDGKLVLQAVKRKTLVVIVPEGDKRKNTFFRGVKEDMYYSTWNLQRSLSWQSAAVTTAGDKWGMTNGFTGQAPPTFKFQYGWFEASVKMPKGKGLWPAFWTKEVTEKDAQEIDAFELVDPAARKLAMHLHGGSKPGWDWTQVEGPGWDSGVDLSADFHTYGVNWTKDRIEWWFDGKLVQSFTDPARIPSGYHYLLLNLAVGGDWPGQPDSTTPSPAEMVVDWVRVWSK